MTVRDLVHNVLVKMSLAPAVRVNGTTTGAGVDLRGFDAAVIAVTFGAYTDGTHTPSVQHSADGTNYNAVEASDLSGALVAVSDAGGANAVQSVGYIGALRYVRVVMTVSGATSGAASGANVIAGAAQSVPVV